MRERHLDLHLLGVAGVLDDDGEAEIGASTLIVVSVSFESTMPLGSAWTDDPGAVQAGRGAAPLDAPLTRSKTGFIAAELPNSGVLTNFEAGTARRTRRRASARRSSALEEVVPDDVARRASAAPARRAAARPRRELVKSFVRRKAPPSRRSPLDAECSASSAARCSSAARPARGSPRRRDQLLLAMGEAVELRLQLLLGQPGRRRGACSRSRPIVRRGRGDVRDVRPCSSRYGRLLEPRQLGPRRRAGRRSGSRPRSAR